MISNLRYTIRINYDLEKITIKNSDVKMSKINVKLQNLTNLETIIHHPTINKYIDGMDKYIKVISPLQDIFHDINKSMMKIKTKFGYIKCSLKMGSIIMYLNDQDMTIKMLSDKTKIKEENVSNIINTLFFNNIVINYDNYYKYVEPYGDIECDDKVIVKKLDLSIQVGKFTDIIMTIESKIISEIKPKKMNIMELERRIQEYLGDNYVRNIFYQRVESLKKRFYIEENEQIISYVV
jgi:DNA-binding transcriptional regulator GbsR (MarR family)